MSSHNIFGIFRCCLATYRLVLFIAFVSTLFLMTVKFMPSSGYAAGAAQRVLTFDDRVSAQRAIEDVYWRHRIWPKENPQPKPPLDVVLPDTVLRGMVENYLRQSNALEKFWRRPISGEQLQAEIERMANRTSRPEVLRELFAALNNDPLLIGECLARPALVERLSREWYGSDELFHGALKHQAEDELARLSAGGSFRSASGEYHEVEWRVGDAELARLSRGLELKGVIYLDSERWQRQLDWLAAAFNSSDSILSLPIERWSGLQEDQERYSAITVLEKGSNRLRVGFAVWRKQTFDQWWQNAQTGLSIQVQPSSFAFHLLPITAAPEQCGGDAWSATNTSGAPTARNSHIAVWTGAEMIVWSGLDSISIFNSGAKYNPATDAWVMMSTAGAPSPRSGAAGVWTGTEMVVWGGSSSDYLNTGGRYNPSANSWRSTETLNSPPARFIHSAVWSGTEMIIWGGANGTTLEELLTGLNSGGRYNPSTDAWASVNPAGSPERRLFHSAIWSGSEMIVWGGFSLIAPSVSWNTGGRYNPSNNVWTATTTTGAPSARDTHSAVWTGTNMIIWGGNDLNGDDVNSGGQYNPTSNSWAASSTTNAPAPRSSHTAVWTGNEMIVWGGQTGSSPNNTPFNSGARYNPTANNWVATSTANAPSARYAQTAVWANNRMIVWGGLPGSGSSTRLGTGGRYTIASALTISPTSQSFTAGGGNGNVNVSASGSCSWTAASNANWITIMSGSSGSGDGIVSYSVAVNTTTSSRTGTITIAEQTLTVTQSAGSACASVSSLTPNSGMVGSAVTITGANFTGVTALRFASNISAQFTVASDTQITTTVPNGAVTGPITLSKPSCNDVQTGTYTVTCSMITLSPAALPAAAIGITYSQAITVSPSGSYTFTLTAGNLPAGLSLNATTGAITGVPTTVGTANFTITAQGAGSCSGSRAYTLSVIEPNPIPILTSLDPSTTVAVGTGSSFAATSRSGGIFTLAINGSGFIPASKAAWNGADRPTNFINNRQLTIELQDSDIARPGTAGISVTNPAPGGGTSNVLIFTIASPVANISAASFQTGPLAPNSIVAAFGTGMAVGEQTANTNPLPFLILGTSIQVRDSAGFSRQAPLFFVSPGQINYLIPGGSAPGAATVSITSGDGRVSLGTIQIAPVAPGLFTANSSGMGVASANALRLTAGGAQSFEDVAQFDAGAGRFVPRCIGLGPTGESVFLVMYGTGIRNLASTSSVTATVGGVSIPVLFIGAHGQFVGLDQINLGPIPRDLIGRGIINVVISVGGQPANIVQVCIG